MPRRQGEWRIRLIARQAGRGPHAADAAAHTADADDAAGRPGRPGIGPTGSGRHLVAHAAAAGAAAAGARRAGPPAGDFLLSPGPRVRGGA